MKLSVMMPCYQEAENLKAILPVIDEILQKTEPDSEILIVDTMKPMDDTKEICKEYLDKLKAKLRYISRRGGNNYGDAMRTGFSDADGKYLVVMDADGSHNPADIARLYSEIVKKKCGIVIGSRYIKGGDTDNPFILKFMSHVLNISYRILFHLDVKDVSDSYRIYDTVKLKNIELQCDNFDIVEEILIKFRHQYPDIDIREIPILFSKRTYGESKRDLGRFILSYLTTIKRLMRIQREQKT